MIDLFEYESLRVKELPQDFVTELLNNLTAKKLFLRREAAEIAAMEEGLAKENRKKWHEKKQKEHQGAIDILREVGLHPAWNWVGHRDEYIFPSYEDCVVQEDWLWQCMD